MMMQNSTLNIRHARIEDANLLAGLGAQTFAETFTEDNTSEDMASYLAASFSLEKLIAELTDPLSIFFIAEVDGHAAGYAKLHSGKALDGVEGQKPIELVRLYVSRKWLGRGVGQALMQRCIDEAHEKGFQIIWLGVWERNSRALAFYRKWNFREVGEHIFQLGSDPQRDILMQRAI
ncbi:MAG TPA: GNAT family N-acetyltransferase [Pyrinomonadaceae bacterium]|jgi:ribosomal protein S18 acetylase RimI-like enzyme|nr:GNAT family N-acetyltransferase [Pyrinomonadaceae bacterium]